MHYKLWVGLLAAGLLMGAAPPATSQVDEALAAYNRQDYTTALQLWRALAEQEDALAQTNLGLMYYNGRGVPQDYAEALKYFRLAAGQGNALAQTNLGVMYYNGRGVPQNYVEAYSWISLAVAQGVETAAKVRDLVAKKMTPAQINEAQALASRCFASGYKDCD